MTKYIVSVRTQDNNYHGTTNVEIFDTYEKAYCKYEDVKSDKIESTIEDNEMSIAEAEIYRVEVQNSEDEYSKFPERCCADPDDEWEITLCSAEYKK